MSTKKKKNNHENKTSLFDEAMNEFSKVKNRKNPINAENINLILDRHFMKLELIKFNLFGEDFENYGNIVINGQTYYPHKLNLDYLANQSKDIAQKDLNINMEILNSLKKAEMPSNLEQSRNKSIKKRAKKFGLNTYYKKMFKNKSCENIISNNKNKKESIKLPKIKNNLNITRTNMKFFLEKNFFETLTKENKKNYEMKRNNFLKRHWKTQGLKMKLKSLEKNSKIIDNEIINDCLINESKIPQFQYRYKYLESKFNI